MFFTGDEVGLLLRRGEGGGPAGGGARRGGADKGELRPPDAAAPLCRGTSGTTLAHILR